MASVDFKPALKKFDEQEMQTVIEMEHRPRILSAVKTLNRLRGKWTEASSLVAGSDLNIKNLDTMVQDATQVRDKCRVLIAVRTGWAIVANNKTDSIENFLQDCKKIPGVPKALKDKVEKMKAEGGIAAAAEVDDADANAAQLD